MAGHLSAIEGTNLSGLVLDMETTDKTISGLLFGAGAASSSTLITTATASKNFVQLYTKSTATSGDNRGIYNRFYLSGAGGGGESLRTFTTVNNVAAGTAHGAHISLSFGTTGSITGQGLGLRATLHVPNQAQSGGTYAGAQSEIYYDGASSNIAGSTVHSIHRFIQDGNATAYAKALNVFEFVNLSTGSGKMYYGETLRTIVNGSAKYIPLSSAENIPTFTDIAITKASSSTSGSVSVEPMVVSTTMSGIGGVGGRARFYMTTNVALGGWSNALKSHVVYGASGRTTGLGSSLCVEQTMSAGTSSGTYAPLEIELNMGASGVCGTKTSLMYMSVNDAAATTFDTNGYLFSLNGLTAAADKVLESTTVRVDIGGTDKYIPLSSTGGEWTLTHTSASTSGSVSVEPFVMSSTMTGPAGVGGRARFQLDTNVALGGWSNALKGITVYGASGRTTGLGSAICAEMTMSAGTSSGTYAPLEVELNMGASGVTGTGTSFIYFSVNDAASTTFDTSGYLFTIAGLAAGDTKLFAAESKTGIAKTHTLKINIGGTAYYIPLHTSQACGGS